MITAIKIEELGKKMIFIYELRPKSQNCISNIRFGMVKRVTTLILVFSVFSKDFSKVIIGNLTVKKYCKKGETNKKYALKDFSGQFFAFFQRRE